jgi:hypothetical protein
MENLMKLTHLVGAFLFAVLAVLAGPALAQSTSGIPQVSAPPSIILLANASASGAVKYNTPGGTYIVDCRGTIGGATININVSNADGTYTTLVAVTVAGTYGPFSIGTSSAMQAVVSGGSPSGLYCLLEGVGL